MKSQVSSGVRLRLRLELLGAVLARECDAGLGEHAELLERDVLDGGEDLDARRVAPGAGDLLAHALEVRAHALGVEAPDQLRHATPAWRPVTPRSRRWEKKRSVVDRAQPAVVDVADARRREPLAGERLEVDACARCVPNAAWTSSPTS